MFINNPKGVDKRMVVDRQKVKTSSESRRYSVAGLRSGQAKWSGRWVQSLENRQRSKQGGLVKYNRKGRSSGKTCWLTWNIQDELAQRDRKHRDIYTRDNKRHLEGVETNKDR